MTNGMLPYTLVNHMNDIGEPVKMTNDYVFSLLTVLHLRCKFDGAFTQRDRGSTVSGPAPWCSLNKMTE